MARTSAHTCPSADTAVGVAPHNDESPAAALLHQAAKVRRHTAILSLIVATGIVLILIHQGFVFFASPVSELHALTHVSLLLIAFLLAAGTSLLRHAQRETDQHQRAISEAYGNLGELIRERTDALAESQNLLQSAFDAMPETMLLLDDHQRVIKANRAAVKSANSELRGGSLSDIFPVCPSGSDLGTHLEVVTDTLRIRSPQRNRLVRGGPDCSRILCVNTSPVFDENGEVSMVIYTQRDVTEEKARETQARHTEKMACLGMLATGFAHDLGNPLASLSSELQLLEGNQNLDQIQSSLKTLERHVGRIASQLREITDFARRRSNRFSEVSLKQAAEDALRLVQHDPRARGISIAMDFAPDMPPQHMKEDDLVLLLVNLMLNAFDAMPNGGTLSISGQVYESGAASLGISDTGVGMDADSIISATQPLYSTKEGGTGLGLALCREIMRSHHGELTLYSEGGKGTIVQLMFPARSRGMAAEQGPAT